MTGDRRTTITSIVLAWNRREDTLACLASLAGLENPHGCDHRIVVVDNGSRDGTAAAVHEAFPGLDVLVLPDNVGFAAGANAGLRHALAEGANWTLLVNNDTVAEPKLLARLLEVTAGPNVGLVTPTICYADAPDRIWPSAGWRRPLTLAAFDTTARPPTTDPYDVDWATGCCLLVRRQVWEQIGLFDERFRVYYEDHDLCLRAKAAGWRILHAPGARVLHRVSASTGAGSAAQMYLLARSSVPYYLTHSRGWHRVLIVVYRLGSLVRTLTRALASGRPTAGVAYVRGLRDGLCDVFDQSRRPSDRSRGIKWPTHRRDATS